MPQMLNCRHFLRYIHCRTTADSAGVAVAAVEYTRLCEIYVAVESPAQYIWVNAVRLCSIFPAFIEAIIEASDC